MRLAHVLAARVPVGQALGVQAPSSDVWLIFQHAAALAGIRIVAIPPSLPPRPIEAIVRRTRCMTVVRERELLGLLEAVSEPQRLADVEENAIAQVQLTSCGEQPSRRAGRLAIAVAASTSRNSAAMASPSTARVASGSTASSANRGILDTLALCPHATSPETGCRRVNPHAAVLVSACSGWISGDRLGDRGLKRHRVPSRPGAGRGGAVRNPASAVGRARVDFRDRFPESVLLLCGRARSRASRHSEPPPRRSSKPGRRRSSSAAAGSRSPSR